MINYDRIPDFIRKKNKNFMYYAIKKISGHHDYISDILFNMYRKEKHNNEIIKYLEYIFHEELSELDFLTLWFYIGTHIIPEKESDIPNILQDLLKKLKERDCSKPWILKEPARHEYIETQWIDARTGADLLPRNSAKRTAYRKLKIRK